MKENIEKSAQGARSEEIGYSKSSTALLFPSTKIISIRLPEGWSMHSVCIALNSPFGFQTS